MVLVIFLAGRISKGQEIAKLMVEKGLSKINNPARRNIITDMVSNSEEYDDQGHLKSKKTEKRTITGPPKLINLSVEELYQAFQTRYEFFIDPSDETAAVINDVKCAVIKFKPKPDLKVRKTADEFINRTSGKVYLNLDNLSVVKVEGNINYHFSFDVSSIFILFIPINVDVYNFEFTVEYTEYKDMVIEKYLTGTADYEVRKRGTEKYTYALGNYRSR